MSDKQSEFFILFGIAIGGGFPRAPTVSTASGVPMLVDYVRVYTNTRERQ